MNNIRRAKRRATRRRRRRRYKKASDNRRNGHAAFSTLKSLLIIRLKLSTTRAAAAACVQCKSNETKTMIEQNIYLYFAFTSRRVKRKCLSTLYMCVCCFQRGFFLRFSLFVVLVFFWCSMINRTNDVWVFRCERKSWGKKIIAKALFLLPFYWLFQIPVNSDSKNLHFACVSSR